MSLTSSLLLNIFLARTFQAASSGWLFYWLAIFALAIQLSSFSLEAGVGFYAARKQIETNKLIGFTYLWSAIATLIIGLIFIPFYQLFTSGPTFPALLILSYIAGNLLISFGNALCFSLYRFVLPHVVAILVNLSLLFLLISGHLHDIASFSSWYFNAFLVQGLILMICIMIVQRTGAPSFTMSMDQLRMLFRYAAQAFIANLLFFLLNRLDYLFVRHYCAPSDFGNYVQVSKIAQMFFMLPSMISAVLFPVIAADVERIKGAMIVRLSRSLGLAYAIILLVLAIIGKQFFPWLYGQSFSVMYLPFLLQCPGIVAVAMMYPYAAYNSGNDRTKVNSVGILIALTILVIGDLLLIPAYGITAAAAVSSSGYCAYYAYLVFTYKRKSVRT